MVQKIPYPPAFLKRTPASPLKALYTGGHWGRSPAIAVSHNGPKNQNTWGSRVGSPWRFFPRSYSISLGQMRKHLRGPGQAAYDFDGVRPGLLVVKTGGGHQAKPYYHLRVFIRSCHKAHAVLWHLLSLCGERRQRRRIICRLSGYSFVGPENQPAVPNAGDCLPLRRSRPEAHTCHLCCI